MAPFFAWIRDLYYKTFYSHNYCRVVMATTINFHSDLIFMVWANEGLHSGILQPYLQISDLGRSEWYWQTL
jgi:hypothetical protein